MRQGFKGECAGSTIAEVVPTLEEAREWLAQAEAYIHHGAFAEALQAGYEAAGAAARVPLYRRLVDPFTAEQALWEFENIFVLSGRDGRSLDRSLGALRAPEACRGQRSRGAVRSSTRPRALVDYCAAFSGEAKAFLAAAG